MPSTSYHKEEAYRCRRLVHNLEDQGDIARLNDLVADHEKRAAQAEPRTFDDPRKRLPTYGSW